MRDTDLLGGEDVRVPDTAAVRHSTAEALSPARGREWRTLMRFPRFGGAYFFWLGCGGLLMASFFLLLLRGLDATGHLPPPALSNNLCLDEKLHFLRDRTGASPNFLVVGSSVAWRGVNGTALQSAMPGARVLNGAFCGLKATQTAFATDWLLQHYDTVREVLMLAVPQDFTGCTPVATRVFDTRDADAYVFGKAWRWGFYYRYFDPVSLIRNAGGISARRQNRIPLDPLVFTPTGDGPLDTAVSRGALGDLAMPAFEGVCFAAMRNMAQRLQERGIRLTVVTMPLKPEWQRLYDPARQVRTEFAGKLDAALAGTDARHWDAGEATSLSDADFTDAIHIRWSAATVLSSAIGAQLRQNSKGAGL